MGRMRRRLFVQTAGAVGGLTLARRAGAQPAPLRVAISTADTYAQAVYAQGGGFFKQAGLTVELVQLPNTGAIAAAVVGGSLDIGLGSALTVAGGREAGVPFTVIAGGGEFLATAPTTLLVVAKDSPLRAPRELEGRIIATDSVKGMTQVALTSWLSRNGADPAKVRYVEMPFTTMAAALAAGHVDAGFVAEPALSGGRAETREFGNPFAAIGNEWYICVWYVTRDWLAKNGPTAHTFAQAIARSSDWANTHQHDTGPMLQKYLPITDQLLAVMHRAHFADRLEAALMQPVLDAGVKGGVVKGTVSAKDLIEPSFSPTG